MYNIHNTTYSEERRSLYVALGFTGLSVINYSESNDVILESPTFNYLQIEKIKEDDEILTNHAMNLAQASLAEDWNDESDEHWESFL